MKTLIVLLPLLFLGSIAFAQDSLKIKKMKEDSVNRYWFNEKIKSQNTMDSSRKVTPRKQPAKPNKPKTK